MHLTIICVTLLLALGLVCVTAQNCDIRNKAEAEEMAKRGYCWEMGPYSTNYTWRPCQVQPPPAERR